MPRLRRQPTTRPRRRSPLAACAAALALAAAAPAAGHVAGVGPLAAAPAAAATWEGSVDGRLERSTRWGRAGTTVRGEFFLTVGRGGTVAGEGVLAYAPFQDMDGLNALLDYARSATAGVLGGLPVFGVFAAPMLNTFIGVRVRLPQQPVRRVRIAGTLRRGRMVLRLVGPQPGLPYQASLNLVGGGSRPLTGGRLAVVDPFAGVAAPVGGGGRWAIGTRESSRRDGEATELLSAYWAAHRVGR